MASTCNIHQNIRRHEIRDLLVHVAVVVDNARLVHKMGKTLAIYRAVVRIECMTKDPPELSIGKAPHTRS